jgi:hypothetical protein
MKRFYLISIFLISFLGHTQIYNKEIEAKLKIEKNNDLLKITGLATNKTAINNSLHYKLSVIKSGNKNNSNNSQTGRFVLEANESKSLSVTSINANEKDRIIILLLIYDLDDNLLGKDRHVLNDSKKK